jgi:L-ascorbate metabolism protein UlaG (beta-lactamase superfamily)
MARKELSRQECAVMVVGGPTAVLDLGGLRIVTDPTFDPPGPHGYLTKTAGPAVADDQLGRVDLVLVSHDNHADNLDDGGRALSEGHDDLVRAFDDAGLSAHLCLPDHGSWIPLEP